MIQSRSKKMETDILVGGQAVLEGVMMRSPHAIAVAVRKPDGDITVKTERAPRWTDRFPFLKIPLVRGTAILIQSLILGIRALNFSAEVAMVEATDPEEKAKGKDGKPGKLTLAATLVFSLAAGVAMFVFVPYWLSQVITAAVHPAASAQVSVNQHWLFFNLVDGVIRVIFFLAYVAGISMMKDIRRVFQYHGAEHKVVHLWEAKEPFEVADARKYSTLHPRCGTSFLLFVMVVSIIVFTLFKFDWWVFKLLARVVLLPLVAGISYELIRLSARFPRNPFFKAIMTPGLMLQKITTRPPSDDMLEVSLRAMEEALALEEAIKAERTDLAPEAA